jgi:hypothetical protein
MAFGIDFLTSAVAKENTDDPRPNKAKFEVNFTIFDM